MDFKGITWAGNIYQKFETMCLEVEEVMYEDTVKYVENQVQKVGVSVKKFYSEVMQDLLPPSCVDPTKAAGDLSFESYANADTNEKPKPSMPDSKGMVKKENAETNVIYDPVPAKESPISVYNDVNPLSPISARVLVENTCSELGSGRSKVGIHKRPIGIKRISQNNRPAKTKNISAECVRRKNDDSNCTQSDSAKILSSESRPKMENSECLAPASDKKLLDEPLGEMKDNPAAEENLSIEHARQTKDDSSECTSPSQSLPSECTSMNRSSPFLLGSSFGRNACEVESVATEIVKRNEGTSLSDGSFCQPMDSSNTCDLDITDNFDMEVIEIENDEVAGPNTEIFEPVGRSTLEETCVFVEGDGELNFAPEIKKHKSYKKKIREALSSKLRSPRKQVELVTEFEEVSGQDTGVSAPPTTKIDSDKRTLSAQESSESEWELL